MTKDEYAAQLDILNQEHRAKCDELAETYAMANNPYKVGDILRDYCQIILVERIGWGYNFSSCLPQCVYYGKQLTTKLVPKKHQDINPRMGQSNVKRKLN